jgi:hypothetical protein
MPLFNGEVEYSGTDDYNSDNEMDIGGLSDQPDDEEESWPEPPLELHKKAVKACLSGTALCSTILISPRLQSIIRTRYTFLPDPPGPPGVLYYRDSTVKLYDSDLFRALCSYSDVGYPAPFRPTIEKMLLFYVEEFYPYCLSLIEHADQDQVQRCRIMFSNLLSAFLNPIESGAYSYVYGGRCIRQLQGRWEAGLLRETQVRLICMTLERSVRYVKRLMERNPVSKRLNEGDFAAFESTREDIWYSVNNIIVLFCSSRFRSERLELLILRYVEDGEEVNSDVVEGIMTNGTMMLKPKNDYI